MIRHVAGLADIVEDVNEALKFYRDTLGLEVKEQDGDASKRQPLTGSPRPENGTLESKHLPRPLPRRQRAGFCGNAVGARIGE